MVNYNVETLKKLLLKANIDCDSVYFQNRLLRATMWLQKFNNSKYKLLEEFNIDYYKNLNEEELNWLNKTIDIIEKEFDNTEDLQAELYAVVKNGKEENKELKAKQKIYFQIIYNLILGQDKGPKMGLLLSVVDKDKLLYLVNNKNNIKLLKKEL